MKKGLLILVTALFLASYAVAQRNAPKSTTSAQTEQNSAKKTDEKGIDYTKDQSSETTGSVTVNGKAINYTARTGLLVLKNANDKPILSMSYTAYFANGTNTATRPITFIYNGGPGSATFWLHMGSFGPKRIFFNEQGRTNPPYKTIDNQYSLLDASDLVFIDAPGTGFGEVLDKDRGGEGNGKMFFGIDEDAGTFTNFIERFITSNNRWDSPKYLFGESYGTFRSAVVSRMLQQRGITLNGVMLLSQLFSYANMTEGAAGNTGNDMPYILALPSMTATAWYHKVLSPSNQAKSLETILGEVEHFATTEYASALMKGATISNNDFKNIAVQLHNFTGLKQDLIEKANLRLTGPLFEKNLLGDSSKITGRLDTRFIGDDFNPTGGYIGYDPMDSYINGVFTANFNTYMRETLKFGDGLKYKTSGDVQPWNFRRRGFLGFPNVMADMAQAIMYDPDMKVLLMGGYYDLGTPYFEGKYEMQHLPMPKDLQSNISYKYFTSGHMVYLAEQSLKELHETAKNFIETNYKK